MKKEAEYLHQLSQKLQEILGGNLIGLYQTGSGSLDNYTEGKSDLDVIGVVKKPISKEDKDVLANELDHKNFPCPAKGLDLIICTKEAVSNVKSEPNYELWFSTGGSWNCEGWEEGKNKEIVIFIELCHHNGKILFGKNPKKLFSQVKREWLMDALLKELHWHQTKILDPFHDPLGMSSVLNACRILAFAKNGNLISKSEGGEWFLKNESSNDIVKGALAIRNEKVDVNLKKEEIASFLKDTIKKIKAHR